jgi:SAM-dependent methyltransferase
MLTKINKTILNIYLKHNPSLPRSVKKKINVVNDLLNFKLNFPVKDFKKKKIIDIACGTGEFANFFAINGHKVIGYDFNPKSINHANKLSKKLGVSKNCNFNLKEFYKVKDKADIVLCTAALHHLDEPYKGLNHLDKLLKKGGYMILSFGIDSSNLQHNLMKILSRLNGTSDKDIYELSNYLFKEHIDRCVKYGLRNRSAVIYDQFINPQHRYLNFKKIFLTLKKYKLYSSWPKPILARGDSPYNDSMNNQKNKDFSLSSFYWSSKQRDDVNNFTKNFANLDFKFSKIYKNINNKKKLSKNLNNTILKNLKFLIQNSNEISFNYNVQYKNFFKELDKLFRLLKQKKINLKLLKETINSQKILFKGTSGLGLNFFIFKKNDK